MNAWRLAESPSTAATKPQVTPSVIAPAPAATASETDPKYCAGGFRSLAIAAEDGISRLMFSNRLVVRGSHHEFVADKTLVEAVEMGIALPRPHRGDVGERLGRPIEP